MTLLFCCVLMATLFVCCRCCHRHGWLMDCCANDDRAVEC